MKKEAARFIDTVTRYKSILIYIPGSPDPDAIASAYAIKRILEHQGIKADIFAGQKLSLPQNQAFLDQLQIPVALDEKFNPHEYEAYIVPDFQNNRIEKISDVLPCAAHIDHHEKSEDAVQADFSLIRTDAGATSTLLALLLKNLDLDLPEPDRISTATALVFGIQTATDTYTHITRLDIEALHYLSEHADRSLLKGLNSIPPSPDMLMLYRKMKENEIVYKDWGFYGLGYIDAATRDYIALAADMILEKSGHNTVAVYAVIENSGKEEMYLDVSLRTKSRTVDLNRIIKQITPEGGGRRYKGAYQVKLNYFRHTPEKDLLWQVVEATTIEILRKRRDHIYRTGIESIYGAIKDKISTLFNKD